MDLEDILEDEEWVILHKDEITKLIKNLETVSDRDIISIKKFTKSGDIINKKFPYDNGILRKLYKFHMEGVKILENQKVDLEESNILIMNSHLQGHASNLAMDISKNLSNKKKKLKWMKKAYELSFNSAKLSESYNPRYSRIIYTYTADFAYDIFKFTNDINWGQIAYDLQNGQIKNHKKYCESQVPYIYKSMAVISHGLFKVTSDIEWLKKEYYAEKKSRKYHTILKNEDRAIKESKILANLSNWIFKLTNDPKWKFTSELDSFNANDFTKQDYLNDLKNINKLKGKKQLDQLIKLINISSNLYTKLDDINWKKKAYHHGKEYFKIKSNIKSKKNIKDYWVYFNLASASLNFFLCDKNVNNFKESIDYYEKTINRDFLNIFDMGPTLYYLINRYLESDILSLDERIFDIYHNFNKLNDNDYNSTFINISLAFLKDNYNKNIDDKLMNFLFENFEDVKDLINYQQIRNFSRLYEKNFNKNFINLVKYKFEDISYDNRTQLTANLVEIYSTSKKVELLDLIGESYTHIYLEDKEKLKPSLFKNFNNLMFYYVEKYNISHNNDYLNKSYDYFIEFKKFDKPTSNGFIKVFSSITSKVLNLYKLSSDYRFKLLFKNFLDDLKSIYEIKGKDKGDYFKLANQEFN